MGPAPFGVQAPLLSNVMKKFLILATLLLASCRGPVTVGPFYTSTFPVRSGHDFVGMWGVEIGRGPIAIGLGSFHPENGKDEPIVHISLRFPLW